ncbi:DUF2726 domain-containing protein [Hyphomonas sp.]|uniref:DUF2726 domain-containing protein n=1 Tax=Hyphomonas sp. TaxID=87 RepID=UPI002632BC08|nr:DUF2726 domain-containing protein [Hyphomonas sp.]MDF1805788.1 DUF2726 domain-containing protein [Hyphomonas sp.]
MEELRNTLLSTPGPLMLVGLGALGLVVLFGDQLRTRFRFGSVPYEGGKALLTPPEKVFFSHLVSRVGRNGHVCPKVRIADILEVGRGFMSAGEHRTAFARIAQKHVDFAVMDHEGQVRFVVEVDDSSHDRADRRERDVFVNEAFANSGVAMVRVKPRGFQNNRALQNQLDELAGDA